LIYTVLGEFLHEVQEYRRKILNMCPLETSYEDVKFIEMVWIETSGGLFWQRCWTKVGRFRRHFENLWIVLIDNKLRRSMTLLEYDLRSDWDWYLNSLERRRYPKSIALNLLISV